MEKGVGDHLYSLIEDFTYIPVEAPCCSFRTLLNSYGPGLCIMNIQTLVNAAKSGYANKLPGFTFVQDRIDERMIELFIRKAIRNMGVDIGDRHRYYPLLAHNIKGKT